MRISRIEPNFTANNTNQKEQKIDLLSMFHEKAKNTADMTDTIVVPRTIFKGYLGIMGGTTLITLGANLTRFKKLSRTLNILGLLTSFYGTWAFVRPFIIKDSKGVETSKINKPEE